MIGDFNYTVEQLRDLSVAERLDLACSLIDELRAVVGVDYNLVFAHQDVERDDGPDGVPHIQGGDWDYQLMHIWTLLDGLRPEPAVEVLTQVTQQQLEMYVRDVARGRA